MTPAARIAAAIEVMAGFGSTTEPVDRTLDRWFRTRRFAGSKDRRAIRDLVFSAAREWGLAAHAADSTDARLVVAAWLLISGRHDLASLKATFGADRYAPAPLDEAELARLAQVEARAASAPRAFALGMPQWLEEDLGAALGGDLEPEMRALQARAPVDLRVNATRATREEAAAALASESIEAVPTPLSPVGLRCPAETSVTATRLFRDGLVEIQDEGSQIVALLSGAAPGETIVDYCAGAGGKALAMAAMARRTARIVAFDVTADRLRPLSERARRAGADNIAALVLGTEEASARIAALEGRADRVLVDAPCSGTGTWRRSPGARWQLTPDRLRELVDLQRGILRDAARLVRPGGRLIYATCSILPAENGHQVEAFLAGHPEFVAVDMETPWRQATGQPLPAALRGTGPGLTLTPHRTATDGFFIALMERAS